MVVVVFRSRLRPEAREEYEAMAARMEALARSMPGFVDIRGYVAEDGERVSIVELESPEAAHAWRTHPEHLEAQRLGRERFYSAYRVQVCALERDYAFERGSEAPPRA